MTYSLFQGNPKYYRIIDGIRDFEQMPWLTTRYAKDMAPGDGVLIWKAGDKAGIYANLPLGGASLTQRLSSPLRISKTLLISATGLTLVAP